MFKLCYITCYVCVMLYNMLCYVIEHVMLCHVMLIHDKIAQAILTSPRPFATVQLVQKGHFNGKSRPKAADIVEVMVKLQRDGFRQLTKSVPITVFLKELPCDVSYRSLGIYGIEQDIYFINFKTRAPTERISKKLLNRLLQLAP